MSKDSIIHLKNITKEYPGVVANKNVELEYSNNLGQLKKAKQLSSSFFLK